MLNTSVIIVCYNRKDELRECINSILLQTINPIEIIIVDNNSTDGTEKLLTCELKHPLIRYFRVDQNLGVAGGRNYGIRQAAGDILIFVDDDALLDSENALESVVNRFEREPQVGILAFQIRNYYTNSIVREEFPHIDKSYDSDKEFETTYFIGAGHAIKREVFEKCGLYPDNFFYGMEELDLSFRAISKGYKIYYYPAVVVWHKKSLNGRMPDKKKWIFIYRNRLAISYKYLQYKHIVVLALIWFFKIMLHSKSIFIPIKGFISFLDFKRNIKKESIAKSNLKTIAELKGRVWY